MILIGYPAIGKSTLSSKRIDVIDLDSSFFCYNDKLRPNNWWEIYCNLAIYLSKQNYKVFISSHFAVRGYMSYKQEVDPSLEIYAIVPSLELKDEWIKKLKDRYDETHLEFYNNAIENYDSQIKRTTDMLPNNTYTISNINYDLSYIVSNIHELMKKEN